MRGTLTNCGTRLSIGGLQCFRGARLNFQWSFGGEFWPRMCVNEAAAFPEQMRLLTRAAMEAKPELEQVANGQLPPAFNVTSSPFLKYRVAALVELIKTKERSGFRHKNSDGLRGHQRPQCDGSARFYFITYKFRRPPEFAASINLYWADFAKCPREGK
jgi:hypothetical protein